MTDQRQIADMMVVAISRLLRDGERVFHGVASTVPMVAIQLARKTHAPNLAYINISGGYNGMPGTMPLASTADGTITQNSPSMFNLTDIFDLSARGGLDTAFLSGVQIDKTGALNLSVIGDFHAPKVRLPGGAGSAAILPTTKRAILWRTKHNKKVFVDKLDFCTATGNTDKVVTPLGIFSKEDGLLKLWRVFPYSSLEEIIENTGFPVEKAADFGVEPLPTEKELEILNQIDSERVRDIEY